MLNDLIHIKDNLIYKDQVKHSVHSS